MSDLILQASTVPAWLLWCIAALVVLVIIVSKSLWIIGPTQVGLVRKRFSSKRLDSGSPVAFNGAAGYQAELLTAGMRFKLWPWHTVTRHALVQIPAGQIGVVIARSEATPAGDCFAALAMTRARGAATRLSTVVYTDPRRSR